MPRMTALPSHPHAIVSGDYYRVRSIMKRYHSSPGPFTNDVSGEGEGGGWLISDDRRRRLRDLYTKNSDKGGRGSKISKI